MAPGVATLFDPAFRFRPERQRRGRNRNGGPNKVAQPVGLRSSGPQATKWLESNMQCQVGPGAGSGRARTGSRRAPISLCETVRDEKTLQLQRFLVIRFFFRFLFPPSPPYREGRGNRNRKKNRRKTIHISARARVIPPRAFARQVMSTTLSEAVRQGIAGPPSYRGCPS